ncbi:Gfo/Idh/MocA family oxidoreductase [Clostridium bowmanii]|uniref:Gfo/Idh/MocA family protein n=1 Tax=Clostridium bowmanii TaxID=132925 RepID=UPI001C0CEBC1|nr:Gfo/Idh/MocA family oxidoreductase [Clostridium bowmanii]MBU3191032.1 Gfo/Idh/MocA family oxidoreductase [Clostridium bowmanii]MCA1075355.1 Gfo/Idh/MocA family oxidoreductase [Clostridium bowmanii]
MINEKKIRIGIIGCGGIANGKHMPSLKALSNVEMVAFCDLVLEKAEKAAKEYGCPDANVYTDYNELLQDKTIDVIHVLTPNKSHAKLSIASMKAGKHVMCEKPMAKSAADALEMVNVAKETGKKLTIGYQHRYKAESTYLKKAIDRGDLGEIYFAKATAIRRRGTPTWGVFLNEEEQGGGPLIDIGTHSLDLTLWMMNNYKPKMVVGTKYKKLLDPDCGNPWGPWDIKQNTVEDSAFGFIVMENGATIILESSWALNTIEPIEEGSTVLCGSKAGAQIKNGLSINKDEFGKLIEIKPDLSAGGVAFYDGVAETPPIVEAKRWIDSIINDTEVVVKPYEAYVVSKILEAIYESANTGKAIYFNN